MKKNYNKNTPSRSRESNRADLERDILHPDGSDDTRRLRSRSEITTQVTKLIYKIEKTIG